jgi:putative hydrolase of the HAD superfamily
MMIETLLFDLDDTLYLESEFIASGYRALAQYLSARFGLHFEAILHAMMTTHAVSGRRAVLPMVIERFPVPGIVLSELVGVYRKHNPSIHLLPGYAQLLKRLRKRHRLGILTDGLPEVQMRKITRLGLDRMVDHVVCTWDHGPENGKPSPLGFAVMLDKLKSEASRAVYIGDNPDKDGVGAHAAGMRFVQVLVPGQETEAKRGNGLGQPDFVIRSLTELTTTLKQVGDHE